MPAIPIAKIDQLTLRTSTGCPRHVNEDGFRKTALLTWFREALHGLLVQSSSVRSLADLVVSEVLLRELGQVLRYDVVPTECFPQLTGELFELGREVFCGWKKGQMRNGLEYFNKQREKINITDTAKYWKTGRGRKIKLLFVIFFNYWPHSSTNWLATDLNLATTNLKARVR